MSPSDHRKRGEIISVEEKDAVIARLLERTEWIMEEAARSRKVTERFDQTLDQFSGAISKLESAVERLGTAGKDQVQLRAEVTALQATVRGQADIVKFWGDVRDKIAVYAMALVVLIVLSALAGIRLADHIHF